MSVVTEFQRRYESSVAALFVSLGLITKQQTSISLIIVSMADIRHQLAA